MPRSFINSVIEPRLEMEKRRLSGESDKATQGKEARETQNKTSGGQMSGFIPR